MATHDPELRAHRDWLGLLQPVGLVVSPPALVKAQAVPSRNVTELQQRLVSVAQHPSESTSGTDDEPAITDCVAFFQTVLGWSLDDIAGAPGGRPIPDRIELVLPDYDDTLRPAFAVVDSMGDGEPLMLVHVVTRGTPLDEAPDDDVRTRWSASPQARLERLMREARVRAGVLCNGDAVRLVYAPSGESSGYLTFPVAAMCEVSGRPILAALHMLLSEHRVFSAPAGRRLLDILSESRKYQSEVSNALSDQVLGALWELLRGFQASDTEDGRRIFDQTAREHPQHIYGGLLSLLMRLIFVLYAEDEGLMPEGEIYANNYSVSGLYDRLRSDDGRYPDTMDQRYGGYAWLLSLFQLIFDGGGHAGLRLPTRHGQLFNPDEFPFLAGRPQGVGRVKGGTFEAPRVSDGCIYRVLHALLVLDGERLSYRSLDVEQVGSVYEAMMGYEVERASGRCIAVRPKHVVVDVDALLAVDGAKRTKWLKKQAANELSGASATALKLATTPQDVVAALGRRVSPRSVDATGTPRLMPPGTLYLQPGEERRRTGSHYTPRELTEPIVRTTLRPVLETLGERPTPEQILNLKVCDPAMGSGAFLVETCRQLAERLVTAWEIHSAMPQMPPDEEPLLHARRLVAQRCLYGVDKNPFAVSLAKLSLWLVTLARDHAFTFIDHALKHGDSLVGLTPKQITAFDWKLKASEQLDWIENQMERDIEEALGWRDALQELDEGDYNQKKAAWWEAENALADARLIGDLAVAAFFGAEKHNDRQKLRSRYRTRLEAWRTDPASRKELLDVVEELRGGEKPVPPLHWEIEFPEVFGRGRAGFDAVLGNPPFMGGQLISGSFGIAYFHWLTTSYSPAGHYCDLVAYFFRRAFGLVRDSGSLGLLATSTISVGDTRNGGLTPICQGSGYIYSATTEISWPGSASLLVSAIHISKNAAPRSVRLNGNSVRRISAYLKVGDLDKDPERLSGPNDIYSKGTQIYGQGFLFCDGNEKATPVQEMWSILRRRPDYRARIRPYIGGKELCRSPKYEPRGWAIYLSDLRTLKEAQGFPELLDIVREKVKPERDQLGPNAVNEPLKKRWWAYQAHRPRFYEAASSLARVLAAPSVSPHVMFTFLPSQLIYSEKLVLFPVETSPWFALLQSRVHEVWARMFGSVRGSGFYYTPSDCFGTFPLPPDFDADTRMAGAGSEYLDFRADLMIRRDEGLTKIYNRFHDPDERDLEIFELRELHAAMDRAVLATYGWGDVSTDCEFLLNNEVDEESWGKTKRPYRYRWPDRVHEEVLARLLDLNQKQYAEGVVGGLHAEERSGLAPKRAQRKAASLLLKGTLPLLGSTKKPSKEA